jgi:cytoplasmic iron level regulating protein YaaA (DUF328/UPF0246 family)
MLYLLSPAKSLDYASPIPKLTHTQPGFTPQASALIEILKNMSARDIGSLMNLSESLSALNLARYQAWKPKFTPKNSRQALLAFNGDVYEGLEAKTLTAQELTWAQEHVCILSGLYGVLRPLDLMQPYRLEMGTRLPNAQGTDLYKFWGSQIAEFLNARMDQQLKQSKAPAIVVNLASQEYFKAVDRKILKARVVECVFEDYKSGHYKVISFHAKRARGLMTRFAISNQAATPLDLTYFDREGYAFSKAASEPDRLVFRRSLNARL